jgi:hypothetical protein
MARFQQVKCPQCGQPLRLAKAPDGRFIYICGCPGVKRELGGEDREVTSGALSLGPEEDNGASA